MLAKTTYPRALIPLLDRVWPKIEVLELSLFELVRYCSRDCLSLSLSLSLSLCSAALISAPACARLSSSADKSGGFRGPCGRLLAGPSAVGNAPVTLGASVVAEIRPACC